MAKRTPYAIIIFVVLITTYTYILPKSNWNSTSRVALTRVIVEEGVFYIDTYHEATGDKAYFNGHYYLEKSIGPSMVAVPAYFVYKQLTALPILSFLANYDEVPALLITTWISTSLPAALLGVAIFLFTSKFTAVLWHALLVTLAYGLGTIALTYSSVIFQHQLSAAGLFITFYILWLILYENKSKRWLWWVGLCAGITMISDHLSIPLVSLIMVWALYRMRSLRWMLPIVIGASPAILLFLFYNAVCFGNPLSLGYSNTMWTAVHEQGFFGLTIPKWDAFWGITFSSFRGLFFISPYLLLGLHGLFVMWKDRVDRSVVILFCAMIALTFLYNASAVMWWAGWSVGPRYAASVIPFLAVPVLFSLKVLLRYKWGKILLIPLFVFSFANVWIQTLSTNVLVPDIPADAPRDPALSEAEWSLQQYQEGHILYNPLFEYAIPGLLRGDFTDTIGAKILGSENIFTTLVPLFVLWIIEVIVILRFYPRWRSRFSAAAKPGNGDL